MEPGANAADHLIVRNEGDAAFLDFTVAAIQFLVPFALGVGIDLFILVKACDQLLREPYFVGVMLILFALLFEHWLARRRSLNWINTAFFRLNALISVIFLTTTVASVVFIPFTWSPIKNRGDGKTNALNSPQSAIRNPQSAIIG